MRKYENVDVIASLEAVMRQNTRHYQSDFEYDKATIQKAAGSRDPEEKNLLWMSRDAGTWCFQERDLLIRDSEAFLVWSNYEASSENIIAFQVEVSGARDGKVMGSLYEMDYRGHLEHLKRAALPAATVQITFEDGSQRRFDYEDYHARRNAISLKYGDVIGYRLEPENPGALETAMRREQAARQRLKPGNFERDLARLSGSRKSSVLQQLKAERPVQEAPAEKAPAQNIER